MFAASRSSVRRQTPTVVSWRPVWMQLVMEDIVVAKDENLPEADQGAREAYLAQFQLD